MARTNTKKNANVEEKENDKQSCSCCGRSLALAKFYKSSSILNKNKGIMNVCKDCIWSLVSQLCEESEDVRLSIYKICRLLDMPYIEKPFNSAVSEATLREGVSIGINGLEVWKKYVKNLNSLGQYSSYTFENGDVLEGITVATEGNAMVEIVEITETDKQNEKDVIRMLGYDPFETENEKDRRYLFNRLVDMIDDSMLEDNMKLMSVVEIIKGFNQIDKLNQVLASITSDLAKLSNNSGNIKTLIDTKEKLTKSILKVAEENRISEKHSGSKTVGAGTLSGMIKKLSEMSLEEAEVNLFDIQTSQGMRQVAQLSSEAITNQLQLDENDYVDMINWQKVELENIRNNNKKAKEENRKLKVILNQHNIDYSVKLIDVDWDSIE